LKRVKANDFHASSAFQKFNGVEGCLSRFRVLFGNQTRPYYVDMV